MQSEAAYNFVLYKILLVCRKFRLHVHAIAFFCPIGNSFGCDFQWLNQTAPSQVLQFSCRVSVDSGFLPSLLLLGLTPPAAFADDLMVVMEAFELARGYNVQRLEQLLLKQLLLRMDIISAGWILARALDIQAFDLVGVAVDFLARAWCMGVTGMLH